MPDLVLLPTAVELDLVGPRIQSVAEERGWQIERCGFGPIVAAARTAQLIAQYRPTKVLLVGIAGSYRDSDSIATARQFDSVVSYGVGIGESSRFVSAGQIGWPQWSDPDPSCQIEDAISLTTTARSLPIESRETAPNVLLTCCAGASNDLEAADRRARYPDAIAEDMEGFGVAVAARLSNVAVGIIRGISNRAGNRDHQNWQIAGALEAAAELTKVTLRYW